MASRAAMLAGLSLFVPGSVAPAFAEGADLAVRVVAPPPVPYDATALGRATHRFRLLLTNRGSRPLTPTPLSLRFVASRGGIDYPCEPRPGDPRWPQSIEPGATQALERSVTCQTPLPGRYDVTVHARPRSAAPGADESERVLGTTTLQIDGGTNAPVRLPWDSRLWAAATATKQLNPSPHAQARVMVAIVNGGGAPVPLARLQADVHVVRRGAGASACPTRTIDLGYQGTLEPGKTAAAAATIACDFSAEGVYDVAIGVRGNGARVHLGTHALRVEVVPYPHPGPSQTLPSDFTP